MNVQIFPKLYSISSLTNANFWQDTFDSASEVSCESFIDYCESEFEAQQGHDNLQKIATAAINDLFALQDSSGGNTIVHFLQFSLSTLVANFVVNNKMTGYAYNWIANSLSETLSTEPLRTVETGRIATFIQSDHPFINGRLMQFFPVWCHSLFYYSRITGGHVPLAKAILEDYGDSYMIAASKPPTDESVLSLCDILAWCILNSFSDWQKKITDVLLATYADSRCPVRQKKIIAFQFSCVANSVGGKSQKDWSKEVLTTYQQQLRPFEKIQIMVNYMYQDANLITENAEDFLKGIDAYHESIGIRQLNISELGYELSRSFEVIVPVLLTLIKAGKGQSAFELLTYFFNIQDSLITAESVLHIVPNDIDGPLYHLHPTTISDKIDNASPKYIKLVENLNTFLQSSIFLTGLPEFQPDAPPGERVGSPLEERAESYYGALSNYFRFDELNKKLPLRNATSYYLYSSINYPLQPLMIKQLGFALAMTQSGQQPETAREVKSVLLWQDDSLLSSVECNSVIKILNAGGINTKLLVAQDSTIEEFQSAYESNDYDLVYISAHGQHNHYEPHTSYIQLSETIKLDIDKIQTFENKWEHRRLAFLNICDGATTALFNSPVSLGMGSYLIHGKQSVISHLWPVVPRIAILYGVIVATCLVRELPYQEVYKDAVLNLMSGKEAAIKYLSSFIDDDTMVTIKNIDIDTTNFTHWGSLAYFE